MAANTSSEVLFEWDRHNTDHIADHGVSSSEAEQVVSSKPLLLALQKRSGEERLQQVGESAMGRILVVVTTARFGKVRVVTAYDAPRAFRRMYEAWKDALDDGAP